MFSKLFFTFLSIGIVHGLGNERSQYHFRHPIVQAPIQLSDNFDSAPSGARSPYAFGYSAEAIGGSSARQESSDGSGKVTGSYTVNNEDGSKRIVKYIADHQGFRAEIDTNEAGTKSDNPADVALKSGARSQLPPSQNREVAYVAKQYNSKFQRQPLQYNLASEPEAEPFPYSFQYNNKWEDGGSARTETSDGSGKVSGSYSLSHADGQKRTVDYTADAAGFKASIQTNEFGIQSDSPADVKFVSTAIVPEAPKIPSYSVPSYSAPRTPSTAPYSYSQSQEPQQTPFQTNFGSAPEGKSFPYSFNYDSRWNDGSSSRNEKSDGSGSVTGSYSLSNNDGRRRTVEYSADSAGFKAEVPINEFGTKSNSPADGKFPSSVIWNVSAPQSFTYLSKKRPSQVTSSALMQSAAGFQKVEPTSIRHAPRSPYAFNYAAAATGGASYRQEASDGSGKVTGSYSVTNEDGSKRVVEYIADALGFRAKVKTNEPGTKSDSPADVSVDSSAPEDAPEPQYSQKVELHKFPAHTSYSKIQHDLLGQAGKDLVLMM